MIAGVIGFGSAGSRHAEILESRGFSIAVLRSFQGPTKRSTPSHYRELRSIDDLIESQPELVVVCSPTSSHYEESKKLISAGIPVIVEKPFIADLSGVNEIEQLCHDKKTFMYVAYHLQFHPAIRYISEKISQNPNNQILLIRSAWGEYLPDWHPNEDYRLSYAARQDQFGGPVLTLSHVLDYSIRIAGPVLNFNLMTSTIKRLGIETEELAVLDVEHETGCLSSIAVDYLTRPTRHRLEVVTNSEIFSFDFQTGELIIEENHSSKVLRLSLGEPPKLRMKCFEDQIDHFISLLSSRTIGINEHDKRVSLLLSKCQHLLTERNAPIK